MHHPAISMSMPDGIEGTAEATVETRSGIARPVIGSALEVAVSTSGCPIASMPVTPWLASPCIPTMPASTASTPTNRRATRARVGRG